MDPSSNFTAYPCLLLSVAKKGMIYKEGYNIVSFYLHQNKARQDVVPNPTTNLKGLKGENWWQLVWSLIKVNPTK